MKDQSLKTGIGVFFFVVALIFVYRSFYAMRIPEEDAAGTDTTLILPHDHRHEDQMLKKKEGVLVEKK